MRTYRNNKRSLAQFEGTIRQLGLTGNQVSAVMEAARVIMEGDSLSDESLSAPSFNAVAKSSTCTACNGTGYDDYGHVCPICGGRGYVMDEYEYNGDDQIMSDPVAPEEANSHEMDVSETVGDGSVADDYMRAAIDDYIGPGPLDSSRRKGIFDKNGKLNKRNLHKSMLRAHVDEPSDAFKKALGMPTEPTEPVEPKRTFFSGPKKIRRV